VPDYHLNSKDWEASMERQMDLLSRIITQQCRAQVKAIRGLNRQFCQAALESRKEKHVKRKY